MPARIISNTGIELICKFEGYSPTAYLDIAGVWTIGYGTTYTEYGPITKGMVCTQEQAKKWMRNALRENERAVSSIDMAERLTQPQFDACISLTYNIGSGAFAGSTIAKKIRGNAISSITEINFISWNKVRQNGILVESRGLTRRRRAEYQLFVTGQLHV